MLELGDNRIETELELRRQLDTFEALIEEEEPEEQDLSLYSLTPTQHVKIYRTQANIDIEKVIEFPGAIEVVHHKVSRDLLSAVIVTREAQQPRWSESE